MTGASRAWSLGAVALASGAVLALVATVALLGVAGAAGGAPALSNVHKRPVAETVTNPCSLGARLVSTSPAPVVGQPFFLLAQVTPGPHSPSYCVSGLSFHWIGLPAGCAAGNTPVASCLVKTPGTFHPLVVVSTHYAMAEASVQVAVGA